MIDFNKAKIEFLDYTSNFPKEDEAIQRKIYHSLRVINEAEKIAESLGLSEEEIKLAKLIGLLHDIGRFEQRKIFNTFEDKKSFDHGNFGEAILRTNNYIRTFINDNKYDEIIFKAIRNHNKFSIEEGLDDYELLFAKIIRDADKLDIIYEGKNIFWRKYDDTVIDEKIDKYPIETILSGNIIDVKLIDYSKITNMILTTFALVNDLCFKYSLNKVLDKNYLEDISIRFEFKDDSVKQELIKIAKFLNEEIKKKL